jgi:Flp pilus assembly protein TadD
LIKADLDIRAGANDDALKDLSRARELAPQDPRIYQLMAEANVRARRIDDALMVLDQGLGMNPHDLPMLRRRLEIIMNHQKWHLAQAALASLEAGLAEAQQSTAEIHLASARYHASLRDYPKASAEYSVYLTQVPGDARAWIELGSMWEGSGRLAQALATFHQASTMAPGNPTIIAAVQRLEGRVQSIRSGLQVTP